MMKKIFCDSAIALLGTIYSVTFIVMATINMVYRSGISGLWGLLLGYGVALPFVLSLAVVAAGIGLCVWGILEKEK